MSDAITLKKISQLLNISISTASRALKDHPDIADIKKLRNFFKCYCVRHRGLQLNVDWYVFSK